MKLIAAQGRSLKVHQLRTIYQINQIVFKQVKVNKRWRLNPKPEDTLKDNATLTALENNIQRSYVQGIEIIHADECIFHQRVVQKKAWARKGLNVSPSVMLHYEPCIAVVGFVSAMRGPILFDTRKNSIKSVDFLAILQRLRSMSGKR